MIRVPIYKAGRIKMQRLFRVGAAALVSAALVPLLMAQEPAPAKPAQGATTKAEVSPAKAQPRPHGQRVRVDPSLVAVEDGDSVVIKWNSGDIEAVRILGIDTPETRHLEHSVPFDQPFGPEARAFARGAFAAATEVELLRSATLDPYDRTLSYLFINGRNYSLLAINSGLTTETVSHYGDNGLPQEAAAVLAAAKDAAPIAFEPPYQYRARMRVLTNWLKEHGQYPTH
jgi:micrococcal nuclease